MSIEKSQNVGNILERIKISYDLKTDIDLSRFLGLAQNTVATWKTRNTCDYERIIAKCDGLNLHWLFTGEGMMYSDNDTGRALQKKANAYNPERDDNIGAVLDGRFLMESKVYTNVITQEEIETLESLTKKLRSLI